MKEFKGTKDEIKKFFTGKGYLIVDKDNYILDLLDNEHNTNLIDRNLAINIKTLQQ